MPSTNTLRVLDCPGMTCGASRAGGTSESQARHGRNSNSMVISPTPAYSANTVVLVLLIASLPTK
jgi:hypothetical protein